MMNGIPEKRADHDSGRASGYTDQLCTEAFTDSRKSVLIGGRCTQRKVERRWTEGA